MSEILNPVSYPSRSVADDMYFFQETIDKMRSEVSESKPVPVTNSDSHVALDVTNLYLLAAAAGEVGFAAFPRMPLKKTFSRKGSQRGIDKNASESAAAVPATVAERSACSIHVASESEGGMMRLVTTPTAGSSGGSGRFRRINFRRQSPWLDPRRILVIFATLSSVGTLILLYFTLSMGR